MNFCRRFIHPRAENESIAATTGITDRHGHHQFQQRRCLFSNQCNFQRNPTMERLSFENCIGIDALHQLNSESILLKSIERRIRFTTITLRTVHHQRFFYYRRRRRENKIVIFFVVAFAFSSYQLIHIHLQRAPYSLTALAETTAWKCKINKSALALSPHTWRRRCGIYRWQETQTQIQKKKKKSKRRKRKNKL